jgi:hypothetical protein
VVDLQTLAQRLEALEREQSRTHEALEKAERDRDQYHRLYLDMLERCRKLERGLLGQKAERLNPHESQMSLDVLGLLLSESHTDAAAEIPEFEEIKPHLRRKPTGRAPIPDHVPRVDIEVIPVEVQQAGLDAFERIGQDITEVLERRPASLVVARIIKPKFKRRSAGETTEIVVAQTPDLPIPRGLVPQSKLLLRHAREAGFQRSDHSAGDRTKRTDVPQ